jgi:hydroxymethylbilane synthase
MRTLVLGTRGSALALAQTSLALEALRLAWPGREFAVREIKTTGDRRQDLSLTHLAPGGHGYGTTAERVDPGLFTKELETELLEGRIDVAIHSLKDLPTQMPAGLALAAVLPRADAADVLIAKGTASGGSGLSLLEPGALVATSSLRRQRQLRHLRPDLRVTEVRGNVGTRLAKLRDNPSWAALVLARAGLERLGIAAPYLGGWIETDQGRFQAATLGPREMLPAVGQGAIGLQARVGDAATLEALAPVQHLPTWIAITAERELLRLLGGGCQLPLGVATAVSLRDLRMRALFFDGPEGSPPAQAEASGPASEPESLAAECARQLSRPPGGAMFALP